MDMKEREFYHNVSARLDEKELKMAKYLQTHYTLTSIARKISLADVLRTAIKNEYLGLIEEGYAPIEGLEIGLQTAPKTAQKNIPQIKDQDSNTQFVPENKESIIAKIEEVQQSQTEQETASTVETKTDKKNKNKNKPK